MFVGQSLCRPSSSRTAKMNISSVGSALLSTPRFWTEPLHQLRSKE